MEQFIPQQYCQKQESNQLIISGGFELDVITTEVDSLRDQRNRVLLKSLLARGNCTHAQGCALWGSTSEVSHYVANRHHQSSPAKTKTNKSQGEGLGDQHLELLQKYYLKRPVFNKKLWYMKINNKELPYTVRKKQATETAFERA